MGIPEELYFAMLEVGYCARRYALHDLSRSMIDTAHRSLEIWRSDEKEAMRTSARILSGKANILRETTGQLPEPLASACWRLIELMEYLASHVEQ